MTNGVPVIVERAMWWPGPTSSTWGEAPNSPGVTVTASRWALAEGEQNTGTGMVTYILVANTSPFATSARATLLLEDGTTEERTFDIAPTSRFNVSVDSALANVKDKRSGALIESNNGAQLVIASSTSSIFPAIRSWYR